MGLLDDAIREHLELKRLRGADPGDVAREEHEALGEVRRDDDAAHEVDADERLHSEAPVEGFLPDDDLTKADDYDVSAGETAEIDMESVLEADAAVGQDADVGSGRMGLGEDGVGPVGRPEHTRPDAEESLEWEVPGQSNEERGEHREALGDASGDGDSDDVLEETPDFLRDAPDQDRLWFEQRPPRDFDFNE